VRRLLRLFVLLLLLALLLRELVDRRGRDGDAERSRRLRDLDVEDELLEDGVPRATELGGVLVREAPVVALGGGAGVLDRSLELRLVDRRPGDDGDDLVVRRVAPAARGRQGDGSDGKSGEGLDVAADG
jgi:hypothetical protein